MAHLKINEDTLERLRAGASWENLAEQIGISGGTLSRIRSGKSQPGPKFIAEVITRFPVRMEDLVTVAEDDAA